MPPSSELKRGLTLSAAIAVNVANMIGTGVFLKSRVMTCNVGSASLVLVVWLAAGLLSLAGTFVYSELAAMLPDAGGEYVYLRRAFGPLAGFLNGWTNNLARSASQAALAVGLAIFMNVALQGALASVTVPLAGLSVSGLTVIALLTVATVTLLNCASVTASGRTALVLTVAKVVLVALVALVALIGPGDFAHLVASGAGGRCEGVAGTARGGLAGFGAAMLGALWAYDGWNNVAPLVGELKDPKRNAPRAFVGGTLVVGTLYLLANLGYFYALGPEEVASIPATGSVATAVLLRVVGPVATTLMAVALMASSFGSQHASALAGARVTYAMANDGLFFRALTRLSAAGVPARAVLLQGSMAAVLVCLGTYDTLTDAAIFSSWIFFGLTGVALFVLRAREPDAVRPYRVPGYPWVPAVFVLVTIAILVNTFVATPVQALESVALLVLGLPFYAHWSRARAAVAHTPGRPVEPGDP